MNKPFDALGSHTAYAAQYDPSLLERIDREAQRDSLASDAISAAQGSDVWQAYELSWLNTSGCPRIATMLCEVPCHSPYMVESKSFKLYLNSFNQSHFSDLSEVQELIQRDISRSADADVRVVLSEIESSDFQLSENASFKCIDHLNADDFVYQVDPSLLSVEEDVHTSANLCSHLFRSNCPVTNQPDWASLYLSYAGPRIDPVSLLKYWVSYRQCQDFHEHCVERMYTDLCQLAQFETLQITARFTRRGGIDINPSRYHGVDDPGELVVGRTWRQ